MTTTPEVSIGCWSDYCDADPEWLIEPMDGSTRYLACGDSEDVFQAIATMIAHGAGQVVVMRYTTTLYVLLDQ